VDRRIVSDNGLRCVEVFPVCEGETPPEFYGSDYEDHAGVIDAGREDLLCKFFPFLFATVFSARTVRPVRLILTESFHVVKTDPTELWGIRFHSLKTDHIFTLLNE